MGQLYSSAKVLWFPDRLAALGRGDPVAPVHVRIKPTNVCNHGCYFCAYRSSNLSLGEDMNVRDRIPRAKMMEIVDDLVEMGVQAVTFSGGGEPLIYPHIAEAVRRLAGGGVKVATLTNGSRLVGKVADAFAECATWVRVSIDGWDPESYARYRNVKPPEFDKVLRNLAAFAGRGTDCVLGASLIVDRDNAARILGLCGQLKECGVRHVKIAPCIVSNDGRENNAYHDAIAPLVRDQLAAAAELADEGFEIVDHYHGLAERFDKPYDWCPFMQYLTVIGADCTVYTCQDKAYTQGGVLGRLEGQGFKEFWYSPETQRALRRLDPRTECRHHCVAEAKNRLLIDYLGIDPAHAAFA
jgi:MoaA/NifB/PqqE/SkfB family radical SAM enzyme